MQKQVVRLVIPIISTTDQLVEMLKYINFLNIITFELMSWHTVK